MGGPDHGGTAGTIAVGSGESPPWHVEFLPGDRPTPAQHGHPLWLRSSLAIRLACHMVGAAPFLIGAIAESVRGYRATSDDAVIALRSWDVFTNHGPLVGQHIAAAPGTAHSTFDAGPLLYWFLAIPVHLAHTTGTLWGGALLCIIGVTLAVEAAWSTRRWVGAVGVLVVIILLVIAQPLVILDPAWNPSVGLVWFLTTAAAAWATASGRLGWAPVLILAGSFTAQCHLMFAGAAVGCMIVAPVLGVLRRRGMVGCRWFAMAVAVGAACWIAPIIQEVHGHPGNLSLLLSSTHAGGVMGPTFGLQALAGAVDPHPLLFASWTLGDYNFLAVMARIITHHAATGLGILVVLLAIALGALFTRRRELFSLTIVTSIFDVAAAWTTGRIPKTFVVGITYLDRELWIAGVLTWAVLLWSLSVVVWSVARRRRFIGAWWSRRRAAAPLARLSPRAVTRTLLIAVCAAGVTTTLGVGLAAHSGGAPSAPLALVITQVNQSVPRVEHLVPRGPVNVIVGGAGELDRYSLLFGVLLQLRSDGWIPQTPRESALDLGPSYFPTSRSPEVLILISKRGAVKVTHFTSKLAHDRVGAPTLSSRWTRHSSGNTSGTISIRLNELETQAAKLPLHLTIGEEVA